MKSLLSNIRFLIWKISIILHVRIHLPLSTILKTSTKTVFEMVFQMVLVPTAVWLEMTLFSKKSSHKIEKHSYLSQNIYFDKIIFFEILWSGFVFSVKKFWFFWAWSIVIPFVHKLGPEMVIFRGFTISELMDCS